MDKVANNFSWNPYSWIINNTSDKLTKSLLALGRYRDLGGGWLDSDFGSHGCRSSYILSISSSENSAKGTVLKK